MNKKIAVVGAGYCGMSVASELMKKGFSVHIFEADSKAGGLAKGIKFLDHEWAIEPFYHHWFNKEKSITDFAKFHSSADLIKTYKPTTSFLANGGIRSFDSPHHLFSYPGLSVFDRYKVGISLAQLRTRKNWEILENVTAEKWLIENMGRKVYQIMWKPMLVGKWGKYYREINMAWFWARIHSRTKKLMYPEGGFQNFSDSIVDSLKNSGVKIHFNQEIQSITTNGEKVNVNFKANNTHEFDAAVLTVGPRLFLSLVDGLSSKFKKKIGQLKSMGAICGLYVLRKSLLNKTYWLNIPADNVDILKNDFPFIVLVEHTNMISTKHYNGQHIVYCGNYIDADSEFLNSSNENLDKTYFAGMKSLNPTLSESDVVYRHISRTKYASPVFFTNYSKDLPKFSTSCKNIYWASMSHVYPWDRGTNYAVDIGKQVAMNIFESN